MTLITDTDTQLQSFLLQKSKFKTQEHWVIEALQGRVLTARQIHAAMIEDGRNIELMAAKRAISDLLNKKKVIHVVKKEKCGFSKMKVNHYALINEQLNFNTKVRPTLDTTSKNMKKETANLTTIARATRRDASIDLATTLAVEDANLSWFTKSLFSYLLNLKNGEQVKLTDLPRISINEEDYTRKAFDELLNEGYIVKYINKSNDERFTNLGYIVSEFKTK